MSSASVASVMAAYNWPGDSPRRQKVQRLVDTLSVRLDELKVEPHHPKWNLIDMTTDLDGWQRWTTVSGQEPQPCDQVEPLYRNAEQTGDDAVLR